MMLAQAARQSAHMQEFVDQPTGRLIDMFSDRALESGPFRQADLETTTFGKSGHLATRQASAGVLRPSSLTLPSARSTSTFFGRPSNRFFSTPSAGSSISKLNAFQGQDASAERERKHTLETPLEHSR